ncbi:MAG: zinc-ribbon domain containing protein [Sphingomonadaceae bacterium]
MQDKTLTCRDCGSGFVFTAGEQEFYARKGFANEPTRCPSCRAARKRSQGGERAERQMFDVVCAECGKETRVPFQPRSDRPVYCSDCFENQRSSRNRW